MDLEPCIVFGIIVDSKGNNREKVIRKTNQ